MQSGSAEPRGSLRDNLAYEPRPLRFGTSGRRGDVVDLTQLEIYLNALAELEYLQSLPAAAGGIGAGDVFYYACDLRPSSTRFVAEQQGRGEIAQAIERAIRDAGMQPVNLGAIPTPALTCFALEQHRGSMMITGSHIPFARNGYKTNSAKGELFKTDEAPINQRVEQVRARVYRQPYEESLFDRQGRFKCGHQELLLENSAAREHYRRRYRDFFGDGCLAGKRLLVYQHSAVGRDILAEALQQLGGTVVAAGRSDSFVPIDTENIEAAQLAQIQSLASEAWGAHGPLDAVVSTDGDSDRPLILAVEPAAPCRVHFYGGDLVGMIVAEYLGADAVVVPISCNDAIDRGPLRERLEPKTRIGSPYVIAAMEKARAKGRRAICGWEANGGFLTGSDFVRNGRVLKALPTRDALLPILAVLGARRESNLTLSELFARLPRRFSRAALLKEFPQPVSRRILARFTLADEAVKEVAFTDGQAGWRDENGQDRPVSPAMQRALEAIRADLESFFRPADGFGRVTRLNYVDGVRITFSNGDVAHVRPSGNADELRLYAVADSQVRADAIAQKGVAEPNGILRQLERAVAAA